MPSASATRSDIVLINRDFWTEGNVIGEALMLLAETLAGQNSVAVITQSKTELEQQLKRAGRGGNVRICAIHPMTTTASSLLRKGLEAVRFAAFCFWRLCRLRPRSVYVATNPPLLVPLLCHIYCWIHSARLIYHVQDIHPEITSLVVPMRPWIFSLLKTLDCHVMRNASAIVTINAVMRAEIELRSGTHAPIYLLENPALEVDTSAVVRRRGFVYCGNAGRLQRIPELLQALRLYYERGGSLPFTFAGGGLYKSEFETLSKQFPLIACLGEIPAEEAARVMASFDWALLPLEDAVMRYAFPSKSASYVLAGARILSVCSAGTPLATWVEENDFGINVAPVADTIAARMLAIEQMEGSSAGSAGLKAKERFGLSLFANTLAALLTSSSVCQARSTPVK